MPAWILLEAADEGVLAQVHDGEAHHVPPPHLTEWVRQRETGGEPVRWVWDSTAAWYPELLRHGVRVARCHDLRLIRHILARSTFAPGGGDDHRPEWDEWDGGWGSPTPTPTAGEPEPEALFAVVPDAPPVPDPVRDAAAEWSRQRRLLDRLAGERPGEAARLRLLIAAENSGALAAAELTHDGLPFRADLHDATLTAMLGPRPAPGTRPARMEELAGQIRAILGAPGLNPDSPPHVLRELRRHGLDVESTSRWELERQDHDVIAPLLAYKKLARLASANGWVWMDAWVRQGRFRSEYVPAGVVTGRWSSRGGGALSLPKVIRSAVRADDGWRFVVADAAQLEPRILAAMSRDRAMLAAGAGGDLYQGLVDAGVVADRAHAKVGMLGVLYGGTTGPATVVLPRIAKAYPQAMGLVEGAARTGEAGGVVTTWLGRSSPPPSAQWRAGQAVASGGGADAESRARSSARDWGRFTRNFVVQGTAAEWALAWIAGVRLGLGELAGDLRPHLAFFLHDELVVHTPAGLAEAVQQVLLDASAEASRLLFPHLTPVEGAGPLVPLDLAVVIGYDEVDEPVATSEKAGGTTAGTVDA